LGCGDLPCGLHLATGRPKLIKVDDRGLHFALDPSAIEEAVAQAKARRLNPVAVIIDTVFRCFGEGNVNAPPDTNIYLAAITMLTDQGYAVAQVHHEIKSAGPPALSVSLIGGADTIAKVWRETETSQERLWLVEMAEGQATNLLRRPAVTDDLRPCRPTSIPDVTRQSFTSVPAVQRHSGDKWRRSYRPRTDGR
jgi:hypothetical protein